MTIIEMLEDTKAKLAKAESELALLKKSTATATTAANDMLTKYNAMKPGKEKDAFLKANHVELFKLSKAAAKPAPTK